MTTGRPAAPSFAVRMLLAGSLGAAACMPANPDQIACTAGFECPTGDYCTAAGFCDDGQPAKLAFVTEPSSALAWDPITPAIQVAVENAAGAVLGESSATVTLTLEDNAPGTAITGTASVQAVNGLATFKDLSVSFVGDGYRVKATSGSLTAISTPFDVVSMLWQGIATGSTPPPRTRAAMAFDAEQAVGLLFGGLGASGALDDLWQYNSGSWTELSPGSSPTARYGAAMAYDPTLQSVVLFGGMASDNVYLADTQLWNGTSWIDVTPGSSPAARAGHTMVYDVDLAEIILYGGEINGIAYNDMWFLETYDDGGGTIYEWEEIGEGPSARYDHAMTYDMTDNTLDIFGGTSGSRTLDDTWEYIDYEWVQQTPGISPPARAGASMAYNSYASASILFGGLGPSGLLNDTWSFDGAVWTPIQTGNLPPLSEGSAMFFNSFVGEIVLFGGLGLAGNKPGTYLEDTWQLEF